MSALDLDQDIQVLVGELPEIPCEEPNHATFPNHWGPATHYVRWLHGCALPVGTIAALCKPKVTQLAEQISAGYYADCRRCGRQFLLSEGVQIIGPIKGGTP